jgi:hypothetical protein
MHSHHDTFKVFPHAGSDGPDTDCCKASTRVGWTWMYHILPFIEQDNIYKLTSDAAVASNAIPVYYCPSRRAPTLYGSAQTGRGDYGANGGWNMAEEGRQGVLVRQWKSPNSSRPINTPPEQFRRMTDISDGTSNTLLVAEKQLHPNVAGSAGGDNEVWNNSGWDQDHVRFGEALPEPDSRHPSSGATFWSVRFGGPHSGGFTGALCDGTVRFISYSVTSENWRRIVLISDGQVVPADF